MSSWKRIAISLFPEHRFGYFGFQQPHMTIYQIFFELQDDVKEFVKNRNQEGVERIFRYVNWCFAQRYRAHDIWNAAATAFVEHLADDDELTNLIPLWIKPEIFEDMWDEFEKRRERKGKGKFKELVGHYNRENLTNYVFEKK